jgi:hypothetical protein
MKKVYFACSIAGGRDQAHVYERVVEHIKASGGECLSTIFADKALVSELGTDPKITPNFIWKRDCDWVDEADVIIAEVTTPSLGVGYEISRAEAAGKPILTLFDKTSGRRLSPMISGNPNLIVCEYNDVSETADAVSHFLQS